MQKTVTKVANEFEMMYEFARANITKRTANKVAYTTGSCSQLWKLEGWFLLRSLKICPMPLSGLLGVFWRSWAPLVALKHHPVSASPSHPILPVCVSVFRFPLFMKTPVL